MLKTCASTLLHHSSNLLAPWQQPTVLLHTSVCNNTYISLSYTTLAVLMRDADCCFVGTASLVPGVLFSGSDHLNAYMMAK